MSMRFILIILMLTASADAAVVRLRRVVTVDHSLLCLGDIADVYDTNEESAAQLREVELLPAPLPGATFEVAQSRVEQALLSRRVEIGRISFEGCNRSLITRLSDKSTSGAGRIIASGPSTARAVHIKRPAPPGTGSPVLTASGTAAKHILPSMVSAAQFQQSQELVKHAVLTYLKKNAPDWGTPVVRPLLTTGQISELLTGSGLPLTVVSGTQLDTELFRLAVSPSGSASDTININVRITPRPRVLAAAHDLQPGRVITEADLKWIEVDDDRDGTADVTQIAGQETRGTVRTGTRMRPEQLRPARLIKRGDTVRVVAGSSQVRVMESFKAQRDGVLGDLIPLTSLEGNRTIEARVSGPNEAVRIDTGSHADQPTGLRVSVQD